MVKNNSKKKIVFFDVDNTIINGYTQKYFIKYLFRLNIINGRVLFLSYLWFLLYKLHIVKNVEGAINFYCKSLKGYSSEQLEVLVDNFFNLDIRDKFFLEINKIINNYKSEGATLVLVSTSLDPIVKCVADYLKVDDYIATKLEIKNGLYTGKLYGKAVLGKEKLNLVKKLLYFYKDRNIETYFYSDHFSDEALLSFVDYPFVVNPDKILYNKAKFKGWSIISVK